MLAAVVWAVGHGDRNDFVGLRLSPLPGRAAWALFLPGWFSGFAGIAYANEHLTWQLFAGGGLILAANLLLIARPDQPAHGDPPAVT